MRPLRLSIATGFRFLSRLWHESTNSRVFGLRTRGRSRLESVCVLWIAARRSTGATGAPFTCVKNWRNKMNKVNWTAVAIFTVVVLLVFLVGVSLLGGWGYGGWGRMSGYRSGMMGPGMMGGWGFGPFGWIGMIFMWLIVVGFIVLTALGLVWLARVRIGGT